LSDNKTSISDQLRQAKSRFTKSDGFQDARRKFDRILARDFATELPPELTGAQEGLDYQTPDVEKAVFDHMDVLVMNPTIYDVLMLEDTDTAREHGRNILLWTTRAWETEDRNRWWDRAVGEGQVRHGVKVMALRWHEQTEPDVDVGEKPDDDDYEAQAEYAEKRNKARDDAFKKRKHPFYWTDCDLYGCYWIGDERREEGPDVFFYEYEIPYVEAVHRFSKSDKKFTLSDAGKVGWLGEGEADPVDDADTRKVKCLVRDGRDLSGRRCIIPGCDHPQRTICIYVACSGEGEDYDEEPVEEYDSPFQGCSYFVIGGRSSSDRDPDRRFRPLMYPLYVEAAWQNYLNTVLATMARTDYSDDYFYLDTSKTPQWVTVPEGGTPVQIDQADLQAGNIPALPGTVQRFPKTMSPHLMEMLNQSLKRLETYMPNRFVTGQAFTEASNATGTAFIQQAQQAALPYNMLLSASDEAQLKSRRYEYHAIRYWAEAEPAEAKTRYYSVMTGNTDIVRMARHSASAGEVVWVDAAKVGLNFDLQVRTKSETLAEEGARWLQAKDQHMYGVLTTDQLLRAAGTDDIQGQKEALRMEEIRADVQPLITEIRRRRIIQKASVRTGMDFGALIGQPVFNPDMSVSTQMPPSGDPSAPQGGGAPPQAPQTSAPTTPPNSIMGRSMQQAQVAGPDGGGGPLG
jgi:hypothetical protein